MKYKKFLLIYFFSICLFMGQSTIQAQDDLPVSEYLQALLDLEYQKAIQLTTKSNEDLFNKQARSLSKILFKSGQLSHRQLPIIKSGNQKETQILNLLQKGYYNLYYTPNEPETLKYFFEANEISKTIDNQSLKKITLLAILEFYHFEYAQTHSRYNKYLKEFESLAKTPIEKCWAQLYKLYFLYQSLQESDEQNIDETFLKLEEELSQLPKNHTFFALYNSIKAVQFEYKDNLDEALEKHRLVIESSKNKPFLNYLTFRSYIRISEIYFKKKEYNKGLEAIENAEHFTDKSNCLKDNIYINKFSSKHHQALGNYEKAYKLLNNSVVEQYELDYKDNSIQNSSLEIELQTAEKEKQILIEKEKKQQNRNIALGLGGGLITVSIIGFLLYKNTKKKQRIAEQEKELEIQKKEKLLKDQELNTIDAMIAGQEKERQRLASDLHDSVGATLATAKLQFSYLQKHKDQLETMDDLFQKTSKLLDDAYNEVRTMAHIKNSGVIAKNGLLPAVQKLAKNASNVNNLMIEVQDFGLTGRLENTLEIAIFRVVQELITNIIKHAKASEASISITQHKDSLSIIIEDNGIGFNPKKIIKNEGMGLTSIEKRVEHLEGTMEVDSTPGKGTSVLIDIPI